LEYNSQAVVDGRKTLAGHVGVRQLAAAFVSQHHTAAKAHASKLACMLAHSRQSADFETAYPVSSMVEAVTAQYMKTVRPMHQQCVYRSRKSAWKRSLSCDQDFPDR